MTNDRERARARTNTTDLLGTLASRVSLNSETRPAVPYHRICMIGVMCVVAAGARSVHPSRFGTRDALPHRMYDLTCVFQCMCTQTRRAAHLIKLINKPSSPQSETTSRIIINEVSATLKDAQGSINWQAIDSGQHQFYSHQLIGGNRAPPVGQRVALSSGQRLHI